MKVQENTTDLAYWLSSISTLLYLLQSNVKTSNAPYPASQRNRNSPTLFGRMAQVSFLLIISDTMISHRVQLLTSNRWKQEFRSTPPGMRISTGYSGMLGKQSSRSKVDAKYPALLFKQHLTAFVEKIYGIIRDNLKKEISPFLAMCIQVYVFLKKLWSTLTQYTYFGVHIFYQAPRSTRLRSLRPSSKTLHLSMAAKQHASTIHWQSIVNHLERTLSILNDNHVSNSSRFPSPCSCNYLVHISHIQLSTIVFV